MVLGQSEDDLQEMRKWYAPDAVTLQFAGNIGMFSAGPQYSFLKDRIDAELLYGFVPKQDAEEVLHLLTIRSRYKPFQKISITDNYTLSPLRVGLGLSYYFRSQFSTNWSSAYPSNDYYWWSSSWRVTGGAGFEINRKLSGNRKIKELSFYSEVGTYDLILTSAVKDKTLTPLDILSLSVGVSAGF